MNQQARGKVPETAAAALARLDSRTSQELIVLVNSGPDPDGAWPRLVPILDACPEISLTSRELQRLAAVASSSRALSRTLAQHPDLLRGSVTADNVTLHVRSALVAIAGDDLAGEMEMVEATERYSEAIDEVVQLQVEAARGALAADHPMVSDLQFAVIAMGKWGAKELNYSSDIDLIFVHDPVDLDPTPARAAALALASRLLAHLSEATFDGPALVVDADLRPEGVMGPLSRSLDGYERYYRKWAEAWELQALLKARPAAGDPALGNRFADLAERVVWIDGLDPGALRGIRKIKEQVELSVQPTDIKRARGGIRDIEFAVQILQLVHGRIDPDLRSPRTLDALAALHRHGYIEDSDHATLSDAYRFLRDLEHRVQLWDLRQTHVLPSDPTAKARIGRALGLTGDPAAALDLKLSQVRSAVRDVHERLYFRPILDSLVGSPSARLGLQEASLRLEALGFEDFAAAATALEELTAGVTRRSRVMHQILPLMLDWLSLSPDPDMGLRQLRTVLSHTSDHSSLVTLLQTNPLAGERLCRLLGTGRLMGSLIDRIPEFIPRLADDNLLGDIRDAKAATARLFQLLDSRPDPDVKLGTIRRFVRRRKLRLAARDVLTEAPAATTQRGLSDSADAAVSGALHILGDDADSGFAVVAMGKWGGRELSYESDLDLMFLFGNETDRDRALQTSMELSRVLSEPSPHGDAFLLDAGIRPEGRNGPLARSLESYRRYYARWAEPWELLALIKARPVAGDEGLGEAFLEAIRPVLWQPEVPDQVVRAIRAIKARVEAERIPPGEDPDFHLKLGRGGLSDVEFLTQLLQLQHGGGEPSLRVPGTLEALHRLREAGKLTSSELGALEDAYAFCTRVRLRLHLQTGRVTDSLPTDRKALGSVAMSLGYDRSVDLRERYRTVTRRARAVFERRFY